MFSFSLHQTRAASKPGVVVHFRSDHRVTASALSQAIRGVPAVAAQWRQLAEQVRERRTHVGFLERCFKLNLEERERWLVERRLHEAHPPRLKTLEEVRLRQLLQVLGPADPSTRRGR